FSSRPWLASSGVFRCALPRSQPNDSLTVAPIHPTPSTSHPAGTPVGPSRMRSFIFGPRPLSSIRQSISTLFPEVTACSVPIRSPFARTTYFRVEAAAASPEAEPIRAPARSAQSAACDMTTPLSARRSLAEQMPLRNTNPLTEPPDDTGLHKTGLPHAT